MEENNEKNINLLPEDLKKKKKKTAPPKLEQEDFELEMVRPDSEKLKKAKATNISGSDISLFKKISNWLGDKFKFEKKQKEEKPHIQELQEMVGKTQHVGEVMINDEEVLPDEERGEVLNKKIKDSTNTEEKLETKINIADPAEKEDKESVVFITKEDHEKGLLREKDRTDKIVEEQDKNIARPVEVDLGDKEDNKVEIEKINNFQKAEEPLLEKIQDENFGQREDKEGYRMTEEPVKMKVAIGEIEEQEKQASLWDKIKSFFSHLFAPKAKEPELDNQSEESRKYSEIELAKIVSQKEDDKADQVEHEVSTPINKFASGVKVMQPKQVKESEQSGPTLEERPSPFMQQQEDQGNEELSKAQEELFSEVPESSNETEKPKELEDIFSSVDTSAQEIEQPIVVEQEKQASLWDKIKSFFSHLFAPKAKEIKELEERQLTGEEALPSKEIKEEELQPALEEQEVQKAQEIKLDEAIEVPIEQASQPQEVEQKELKLEEVSEPKEEISLPEENPIEEEIVEGAPESLPASLISPEPDIQASVHDENIYDRQETQKEEELEETKGFFARIKDFFKNLFRPKSKEINVDNNVEGTDKSVAQSNDVGKPQIEGAENLYGKESSENASSVNYNLQDRALEPQIVKEDELSSKFHQPKLTPNVSRVIDQDGGVDLIPIAIRTKSWGQIAQLIIAAIVGSIIIILSFYATLYFQQTSLEKAKEEQQNKLSDLEEKILEYKELNEEIDALGQELVLVNDLLNKHIYWTNLFALIEKYTLEDVYFSGFSAGAGGALSFSATGASYDSAARQLKLLQSEEAKEFIEKVTINSVAGGQGGVTFSVNLILNDDLFYYSQ